MNANEPSESSTLEKNVLTTLGRQQRRLTYLIRAAIALWTLAILGCAAVLIIYANFYAPKEQHLLRKYGERPTETVTRTPMAPMPGSATPQTDTLRAVEQALGAQLHLSYVVTRGVLIVAAAVLVLACGTLATLALVVFSRRVTLRQVNEGLASISEQLQRMQRANT